MTPLVAALVLSGCGVYGFADSQRHSGASGDNSEPAVAVETIATPAHLGIDDAQLRLILIDELELLGLRVTDNSDVPAVRCRAEDRHSAGYSDELVVEMALSCDILAPGAEPSTPSLESRGMAAATLAPGDDRLVSALYGSRDAATRAVVDAMRGMSADLADALTTRRSQTESD